MKPGELDREWLASFLRARAVPGLETVGPRSYCRAIRAPSGPALVWIDWGSDPRGPIRSGSSPTLRPVERRSLVARLLDLDTDLEPFRRMARADSVLGPLVRRRPAVRRPLILDPFEGLVRALVGQQVSVAAARTVIGRIVERFGPPLGSWHGARYRLFPDPALIAAAGGPCLQAVGLTHARAESIAALAAAQVEGRLDWARLAALPGEEAQRALETFRGIGPWTAAYLRMRVLGDPDAFPATDLGVICALERLGVKSSRIALTADRWRPWRAYATIHLWAAGHS